MLFCSAMLVFIIMLFKINPVYSYFCMLCMNDEINGKCHKCLKGLAPGEDQKNDMRGIWQVSYPYTILFGLSTRKRHPLPAKFGTDFANKRRSLGRYSSLADYGHGV
jgi:hypothetical protein